MQPSGGTKKPPEIKAMGRPPERPTDADRERAKQFKITPEEFVRRDEIVRRLWARSSLDFPVNSMARPMMDQAFEEYGHVKICQVFKSYHDFPTLEAIEWPEDDIPFIFTVAPEKGENRLLCVTAGFMRPVRNGGVC
jgi:hypothetical protein